MTKDEALLHLARFCRDNKITLWGWSELHIDTDDWEANDLDWQRACNRASTEVAGEE